MDNPALHKLLFDLIGRESVTPDDAGCMNLLADALAPYDFQVQRLDFADVSNLWIYHTGKTTSTEPVFAFLGHTDVVPPGPVEDWNTPPFEPVVKDDVLYGRGAADMKGSVAAMTAALIRFVASNPDHAGTIGMLLTSDEEGPALHGVRRVMPALEAGGVTVDYCLVGEPSSQKTLGDTVRIGRRGSLNGKLAVLGKQGHAAYPQLARNPLHDLAPALTELVQTEWDQGNEAFPPTSFQATHVRAGDPVHNVIPGRLDLLLNFRFSPERSSQDLMQQTEQILQRHDLDYQMDWHISGEPFYTPPGPLSEAVVAALQEHCQVQPDLNTGGGTSDGRFVAPTGAAVVELGPINASIHQVNEHVNLADIDKLAQIYESVLVNLLRNEN